jgi:hypothetical protein
VDAHTEAQRRLDEQAAVRAAADEAGS